MAGCFSAEDSRRRAAPQGRREAPGRAQPVTAIGTMAALRGGRSLRRQKNGAKSQESRADLLPSAPRVDIING